MAFIKKEYVLKKIEQEQLPYFEIYDGKNLIASNQSNSNVEEALEFINETFDSLEDSKILIKISDKTKAEKGKGGRNHLSYEFNVNLKEQTKTITGASNESYLREIFELKNQLKDLERKQEIDNLKKEFEDFKKEDKNPMMEAAINGLVNIFGQKQSVGVAGHNDSPIESEIKLTAEQRIKAALIKLQTVEKDLPGALEKIAAFAVLNPNQYEFVKNSL